MGQARCRHHVGETRLCDPGAPDEICGSGHNRLAGLRGFQLRLSQG